MTEKLMTEQREHVLSSDQVQSALQIVRAYLTAPKNPDGRTPMEVQTERDQQRVRLIENDLKPLLKDYVSGQVNLAEFKTKVDGINKRNEFWGFKGVKGQMFFNMVVNVAGDTTECDQEIKAAIKVPTSEDLASRQIKTFYDYVNRIGKQHLESGGTKAERPKPGSVPFFVSYFWQIHERDVWPVFYTNSVNTMTDMNLWLPTDEPAADYLTYKHIHEELGRVFTKETGKHFGLYEVEHVFWFKVGNPSGGNKPALRENTHIEIPQSPALPITPETITRLPESYVPPIIAVLPRMARNEAVLREAAKAS